MTMEGAVQDSALLRAPWQSNRAPAMTWPATADLKLGVPGAPDDEVPFENVVLQEREAAA